jgi:hypothetical protein
MGRCEARLLIDGVCLMWGRIIEGYFIAPGFSLKKSPGSKFDVEREEVVIVDVRKRGRADNML